MSKGKLLIIGSGGREHALAWRCHHEGYEAIVAPGNDGMARHGRCAAVLVNDHDALVELARREAVDAAIVGPEQPLVDGLADKLRAAGVPTLGPSGRAAELEASKAAAKSFMKRHAIPTAAYRSVASVEEGLEAMGQFAEPPVVKADGLAAGKGVVVAESFEEAEGALRDCIEGQRFGAAGASVVLEERLEGQEASFFVLSDGRQAINFAPSQDHKRIFDGDRGPNTGGMGAYAPAPICDAAVRSEVQERIVVPTLAGLREEGRPFVGILFVGLMIDGRGVPKVVEYNVRFGDPEAQPLMFGLREEVVPHFIAASRGTLESGELASQPAVTVVMASAGYPASSTKGTPIIGLDEHGALPMEDVMVFHAGTRRDAATGEWQTHGGRVLGVCARSDTLPSAVSRAYDAVDGISIAGGQVRRDIAARAL
jgi:phosphoribosylamine--glycine ligase